MDEELRAGPPRTMSVVTEETRPLLADVREGRQNGDHHASAPKPSEKRKPTPLPKVQIGILMLLNLAEPITSHCIFPFINQVCRANIARE